MRLSIRARSLALAAFVAALMILVVAGSIVLDHRLHVRDQETLAGIVEDSLGSELAGTGAGVVIARKLSEEREKLLSRRLAGLALVGDIEAGVISLPAR